MEGVTGTIYLKKWLGWLMILKKKLRKSKEMAKSMRN
jgi:hypothetical protein